MKKKWILINKKADFEAIGLRYHVDPVLAKVVTNRGIVTEEDLDFYFSEADAPLKLTGEMKDIAKGAEILLDEIKRQSKILVIGDYDADGICSTAILLKTINKLGGEVSFRIPRRIEDGYGMNEQMVEEAKAASVSCIITCDNGISCFSAVERAKELGIKIIITDHHQVPTEESLDGKIQIVPKADAVINPHQSDCPYPFEDICGAMVALRFSEKILSMSGIEPSAGDDIYDLAAVATVTDIMPLIRENRQLVKNRLNKIPQSKNLGLRTLCELKVPGKERLTSYDIGHLIGPCMNATGRISTADIAVELLMTEDKQRAKYIADEMQKLNAERISMTVDGATEGIAIAETMSLDKVLVIYMPDLHESIAGLVAGKIREHTGKPTLVVTKADNGAKGSGRSIDEYSMSDELAKCKDILTKYGGHPMAAGFSLPVEKIDELRIRLNENCVLPLEGLLPKVKVDVAMPFGYVTEKLLDELQKLEPTGRGNEAPIFAQRDILVRTITFMGDQKQHMRLVGEVDGRRYQLVLFGRATEFMDYIEEKYGAENKQDILSGKVDDIRIKVAYTPKVNEYNGRRTIQYIINQYE